MCRPVFLVPALIAALSGTPLRLAEAGDDLARALAENAARDVIAEVDGGVGDDPGETVSKLVGEGRPDAEPIAAPTAFGLASIMPAVISPTGPGASRRSQWRPCPPPSASRRQARLQCFLF